MKAHSAKLSPKTETEEMMQKKTPYQAGEVIIEEGLPGDSAYMIVKGRVEVSQIHRGKKQVFGTLKTGDIFGEMAMVDDKPRSATVTALEETSVLAVHQDAFMDALKNNPLAAGKVLKALFNRLRDMNTQLLQLQSGEEPTQDLMASIEEEAAIQVKVSIEGITPEAQAAMQYQTRTIDNFPFRIGRTSSDPLADNDLALNDASPYTVSRHHISLVRKGADIGILDRGSTLGAELDGRRVGGNTDSPGPIFMSGAEAILVLGDPRSPFKFKLSVESA